MFSSPLKKGLQLVWHLFFFRPVIVDILVLNIINKGILKNDDFQDIDVDGEKGVYLSKDKLKTFFYHFNYRMETERFSDKAGKELSYRDIIKEQVYELIRFIETGENYSPFKLIR